MDSKEHGRLFPRKYDNSDITIASSGETITYYFQESGVDSSTKIYFGFSKQANSICLRTDKTIQITEINGIVQKDPIVIKSDTKFEDTHIQLNQLKLVTTTATTNIKLFAKGR